MNSIELDFALTFSIPTHFNIWDRKLAYGESHTIPLIQKSVEPSWANLKSAPLRWVFHYIDVIMSAMASQISGDLIINSPVCSVADQRKLRVTGLCDWSSTVTGEFPAPRPVARKSFHFMTSSCTQNTKRWYCTNVEEGIFHRRFSQEILHHVFVKMHNMPLDFAFAFVSIPRKKVPLIANAIVPNVQCNETSMKPI